MVKIRRGLIIVLILVLSAFLRFYRIAENLEFNAEMGVEYLQIKDYLVKREIPLLGPPTSHEWFSAGPLSYWIFGLVLKFADYEPASINYFMATVGVITVLVCYLTLKKLFGEKISLLASFLVAVSPSWVELTRNSRINSFTALWFFPFFYYLVESIKNKGKSLFWCGFFLGVMFSFFPSPLVLLPGVIVLLYIYKKTIEKKYLIQGILGILVPNIPYIVFHIQDRFNMLSKVLVWIPYRILGFAGFYPKNNVSLGVIKSNIFSLYEFAQESFLPYQSPLMSLFILTLILFFLYKTRRAFKNREKEIPWISLVVILLVSYLGLFIHGDPPKHYYLVIFPIPIIVSALFLDWLLARKKLKIFAYLLMVVFLFANFKFFFSNEWFYGTPIVSYEFQKEVVKTILKDAKKSNFSISRVGPLDYFKEDFSQNYRYLFWKLGNEPTDDAQLVYTIYEDTTRLNQEDLKNVFWVGNIAIKKQEL